MAYNEKSKAKIRAEYEAGIDSRTAICQKWGMSVNTLKKFARKGHWIYGKNDTKVIETVSKRVEGRLTEKYARDMEDFTLEHIAAMDEIGTLTKDSIARLKQAVKDSNNKMTRKQAEAIFSQQKVLKISSETLSGIYTDKRKALGLDKPKPDDPGKTDLEDRIRINMEIDGIKF